MNSSTKKWQSIRKDEPVEIGLVQVDVGGGDNRHDHLTDLILKHAKDVWKDALLKIAERHGGKLAAWEGDGGTFLFLIEGADGCNNCCLAAMQMLEQLSSVQREVQLSDDLRRPIVIRIGCDACTVLHDPEPHNLPREFVDAFKEHGPSIGAGNKVTLTDRLFRQLDKPLKSLFVKWKHSSELDVDLYATANPSARVGPALAELPAEEEGSTEERVTRDAVLPIPDKKSSPARGWPEIVSDALRSRKMLGAGAVVVLSLMILTLVRFWPTSPPPVAPSLSTPYAELVQSEDWRNWRKQVHEKLSVEKVTESTLADALKIKLPGRPEEAAAALRRDQSIGEVLMAYPGVRDLLWDRFGIDAHNFLGTGLSKPSSALNNYGKASVHEYLIKNYYADMGPVWKLTFDPINNPAYMKMTVRELFEKGPKPDHNKDELVKEIPQRVEEMKEKDTAIPAVIRFARFNAVDDSRKLGPKNRHYVFASNLEEVWNTRVMDAAGLSGYISKKGDTMYIWIFLPSHATDVVPATWDQVINHLPMWLSETDKD